MVAHNPLHRSRRAELPHRALALGDDAEALRRPGMADVRNREPAADVTPETLPRGDAAIATSAQAASPEPAELVPERQQRSTVPRHAVVASVSENDRAQVGTLLGNRLRDPSPQFGLHLAELGAQPLAHRLPPHGETSIPRLGTDVREAEKVERLRLPQTTLRPVARRIAAELQEARLVGVKFQTELREALAQRGQEGVGIPLVLEPNDKVIPIAHDDHLAAPRLTSPALGPQVEHVVQINVRQERANAPALDGALRTSGSLPVLEHAGAEPLLDQPHDALIRDPVLEELHDPLVLHRIEKAPNVRVEHPVHLPRPDADGKRIECLVRTALGPEPEREAEKVRLVNGVQHLGGGPLDELVLQHRHAERPQPPVRFGDEGPASRSRPVRPSPQPLRELPEVLLQLLAVVPPRLAVDARCGVPLQCEVRLAQTIDVVDVMQERGEALLPVLPGYLPYPRERAVRTDPALRPERVALLRAPLGRGPSLHRLRPRSLGFVRQLLRYYDPVRLLAPVHHRRASLDFPMRPAETFPADERETSRLPREVIRCVFGVSDRAGSACVWPWRRTRSRLPHFSTASAPRKASGLHPRAWISRLNTRPAPSPVHASPLPSRATTQDSGTVWLALPSLFRTFTLSPRRL